MVVKTFKDSEIKQLIAKADPRLKQYIKALKSALENEASIRHAAVRKIKELSEQCSKKNL